MIDLETIQAFLKSVVEHYEQSAPIVSRWADILYVDLNNEAYSVSIGEVIQAQNLLENGLWEHPNLAANRVYKLMEWQGMFLIIYQVAIPPLPANIKLCQ